MSEKIEADSAKGLAEAVDLYLMLCDEAIAMPGDTLPGPMLDRLRQGREAMRSALLRARGK